MLYLIAQIWLQLVLAFALGGAAAWWWLSARDPAAPGAADEIEEAPRAAASRVESLRQQLEAARSDARAARDALAARTQEVRELRGARSVPADHRPTFAETARQRGKPPGPRLPEALIEQADVSDLERDDLTRIRGVGPVLAKLLNDMGIHTFREIADWTAEDVDRIQARLPRFPGRIRRDDWVGQAAELDRRVS